MTIIQPYFHVSNLWLRRQLSIREEDWLKQPDLATIAQRMVDDLFIDLRGQDDAGVLDASILTARNAAAAAAYAYGMAGYWRGVHVNARLCYDI